LRAPAATYDVIGTAYARHRRAEPRIADALWAALGSARTILDVGAGTGSYEPSDRAVVAVEPSAVMIAQRPATAPPVVTATAGALPFAERSFDAAIAVLTVHHWADPARGVAEMRRVAHRQVVLTFDPVVHSHFWLLADYVPAAAELEVARALPLDRMAELLGATRVETVPVPHDCVDGFGWAYWRRPAAYLDPEVRSCISMLAQLEPGDLQDGLARLAEDLASGDWVRRHGHLLDQEYIDGGYRLLVAE
jgi:SAM-dependent methyltransferase